VEEFENEFGQTVRLGDEVVWPRWGGGWGRGTVSSIERREAASWGRRGDPGYQVKVKIATTRWRYDPASGMSGSEPFVHTSVISYGSRVALLPRPA